MIGLGGQDDLLRSNGLLQNRYTRKEQREFATALL
ncbi:unannotated protein [freshwater metagenome]|uniref:Unannotated protein n=1 Tax=freshwater metagenome TaxID=449393 RepID=A0A6J7S8Z2_9ZZZZ